MQLIENTYDLEKFIKDTLADKEICTIALDTEFVRETTYWPQLCLIQIATPRQIVIIDALTVDLQPLVPLLQAPHILKVIHSGRQDVEIFWHELKTIPTPLLDTQVAAMFASLGEGLSYDNLIQKLLDTRLDKTQQYTNWAQRPLSEQQLAYAAADVQYLFLAYPLLWERLLSLQRESWIASEHAILIDPATYDSPLHQAWHRLRLPSGRGQNLAVLQDVAAWREKRARDENLTRSRVMKDEVLISLGLRPPQTLADLQKKAPQLKQEQAVPLFDSIQTSLSRAPASWPSLVDHRAVSMTYSHIIDVLRLIQRSIAVSLDLPMRLLIEKGDLEKMAAGAEKENIGCYRGWQWEIFGKQAHAFLKGKVALGFFQNRLSLVSLSKLEEDKKKGGKPLKNFVSNEE